MKAASKSNKNHNTYTVSMIDAQEFSQYPPTSLLQSYEWGRFKQRFGWHPYFFLVTQQHHDVHPSSTVDNHGNSNGNGYSNSLENSNSHRASHDYSKKDDTAEQDKLAKVDVDAKPSHSIPLLVLTRTVAGIFRIAYCAYAPLTSFNDGSCQVYVNMLDTISQQITNLIIPAPTIVRWDMLAPYGVKNDILSTAHNVNIRLKQSPHDIQPASTTIIDITKDTKEILETMKAKTRYNIRLSEKKGVAVHVTATYQNKLSKWYALYQQTAQRDRIAIHSFDYYKILFDTLNAKHNKVQLELLYAEYNREMIGGILVCYIGTQATYLYGASSNNHRNKMGNYLLQWHAIQRAQQMGCKTYDLFGIPPQHNQSHAMGGLYRFKVGFNGDIVERTGCIDWIHQPLMAGICRVSERAYFWFHAIRKRFK